MPKGIIDEYRQMVEENLITCSEAQLNVLKNFEKFDKKIGLFSKYKGVYLYGEVGRGKSLLARIYFGNSEIKKKKKVHFYKFMQEVHCKLKLLQGTKDPILRIGKEWAKKYKLIFLDELHVYDIADAMILARLFIALLKNRVFLVITSNLSPDKLYENGLQRENFLPAISLIREKMHVIRIKGDQDYRTVGASLRKCIINDCNYKLRQIFLKKIDPRNPKMRNIKINGRVIKVKEAVNDIAWFTFSDLCVEELAVVDYQVIMSTFATIFVSGIPVITDRNEMRRFIILVDEMYEHGTNLFCSAECPLEEVCSHSEFERTYSRLIEMCS